jgi:glycosyltransferase involved in cell wall biosynthesis
MRPLNILIVCEHASNVFGGEAMLPLNYFRLLSQTQHQVYLITHERVKSSITHVAELNQQHVYYIPDTWMHKWLHRHCGFLPERVRVVLVGTLMHLITQFYQWKIARRVIREKQIDVIHEPAPVSATQPSAMFGLGVPVIIGPMNGGMAFPKAFEYMSGTLERIVYKMVSLISTFYNLVIPGKLFAKRLLVANQRTANSLPKFRLGEVIELVENGVFSTRDTPIFTNKREQVNVLFVGRLVDWKAVDIVIDAVGITKQLVNLIIVGDGDERPALENQAKSKSYEHVHFTGMVPHADVNRYYDEADIFVLPSVRECGGAVVLEAMARGLPVIATHWGGPADYITAETGYLIEPISREYMVQAFATHIDMLATNPDLRYQIGMAAIQRVKEHFMWDQKIQTILQHYQDVVEAYSTN